MGKHLSDADLAAVMLEMFGARTTTMLLGWATLMLISGIETPEGFIASRLGSQASRYRVVADFRRLAAELRARGYDLDVEETVRRAVHVRASA